MGAWHALKGRLDVRAKDNEVGVQAGGKADKVEHDVHTTRHAYTKLVWQEGTSNNIEPRVGVLAHERSTRDTAQGLPNREGADTILGQTSTL